MSKKKVTSKQKAVAMLLAMTLAFTFCWGVSVLKADAYSNSVTKTWYYNPNTILFKPAGSQSDATISLSGGASDRAHISAVVADSAKAYDWATNTQQFISSGTKNFAYLNPYNAGNRYYVAGMCITTDSLLNSVVATYTFTP
ncbi:MAG: hypothetical protein K2J60_05360 [Acetatifactor sp.]|nr:hypothetical protein [Acetatifactor sp.]